MKNKWNHQNENKQSEIFDMIKKRPSGETELFLDEKANKMIEIIHHEIENNIPEIKIKDWNTNLWEYIFDKKSKTNDT